MKITIAKVFPEDDEQLSELYWRMKENIEYFTNNHQDVTMNIKEIVEEGCILVKSLKLEESVN
jgi:hypothetical protein